MDCLQQLEQTTSPSFRRRIRSSIRSSCFFIGHRLHDEGDDVDVESSEDSEYSSSPRSISKSSSSPSSSSSSSAWFRSKAHDFPEEIKDKCANFISKIGRSGRISRRSSNSTADFSYDPLSYALNFDDESARFNDETSPNFSARLPPTPQKNVSDPMPISLEISAWS